MDLEKINGEILKRITFEDPADEKNYQESIKETMMNSDGSDRPYEPSSNTDSNKQYELLLNKYKKIRQDINKKEPQNAYSDNDEEFNDLYDTNFDILKETLKSLELTVEKKRKPQTPRQRFFNSNTINEIESLKKKNEIESLKTRIKELSDILGKLKDLRSVYPAYNITDEIEERAYTNVNFNFDPRSSHSVNTQSLMDDVRAAKFDKPNLETQNAGKRKSRRKNKKTKRNRKFNHRKSNRRKSRTSNKY